MDGVPPDDSMPLCFYAPSMTSPSTPPERESLPGNPDDRRRAARNVVCVPARVHADEGTEKLALIEDISVTGARLLTRSEPDVGELLRLSLYFHGTSEQPRIVMAKVVRFLPCDDAGLIWRCRVAVAFDESLDDCAAEIEALAEAEADV